jgi:uncharacterized protein (TIGR02996 family)
VSQREVFLKMLAENEDDTATRLVYADWLDDHGEHEEADLQRKWPAAKEWLVRLSKECSRYQEVSSAELLEFGRQVAKDENPSERVYIDNEDMWDALKAHGQEFWTNWSIVTGIPLPARLETQGFHYWRCCAHDVSYWFGEPDASDPEE